MVGLCADFAGVALANASETCLYCEGNGQGRWIGSAA